jgi:prophage maintenance system killer protein
VDNVISIHDTLTRDFEKSKDPISPPGVKDLGLLESAVGRQWAGFGGFYKYKSPIDNAASLCYGVCCNHSLHNGNKRTALVTLLCHLDGNNLTFNVRANQDDMYKFMLKVANHGFASKKSTGDTSDEEVEAMIKWIRSRTRKVQKSERWITFRELKQHLKSFNIEFSVPKNNLVNVIKTVVIKQPKKYFWSKEIEIEEKQTIANIPFFKDGAYVGKKVLRTIRKNARLMPEHGVDSEVFYGQESNPDMFIMKYKKTLNRLAKT